MNLKGLNNLQRFIEFEFLIILLFGVTTYVAMTAYADFRETLASTTWPDSLFCYGKTVHARLISLVMYPWRFDWKSKSFIAEDSYESISTKDSCNSTQLLRNSRADEK